MTTNNGGRARAVLCFLSRPNPLGEQVLLSIKMKGIGKGCRMGYGGGIENGETARQATRREVLEESHNGIFIRPHELIHVAVAEFHTTNTNGSTFICEVNIFIAPGWCGDFYVTPDMSDPWWYTADSLPLQELMPADVHWLKTVLENNLNGNRKYYRIAAAYGPDQKHLVGKVIVTPVDSLSEE